MSVSSVRKIAEAITGSITSSDVKKMFDAAKDGRGVSKSERKLLDGLRASAESRFTSTAKSGFDHQKATPRQRIRRTQSRRSWRASAAQRPGFGAAAEAASPATAAAAGSAGVSVGRCERLYSGTRFIGASGGREGRTGDDEQVARRSLRRPSSIR